MTLRRPRSLAGGSAIAFAVLLSGCAQPVPPPPGMAAGTTPAAKADTKALAAKLVQHVAAVKEWITRLWRINLLEEILGANPVRA